MPFARLTETEIVQARQLWAEYQKQHDVSHRKGQAAGIDPRTGRIWFGESALEIARQIDAEGAEVALLFERVGYPTYLRKGGPR